MKKVFILSILIFIMIISCHNVIDLRPTFFTKNTISGIDISHHNNVFNWTQVKKKNKFCIIKATQGHSFKDPKFNSYWSNSKKNGITRGAYHFFSPDVSAEKQFINFKRNVKLTKGDLPPILDVELKEIDVKEVNKWLELVESHYKVKPIIYTEFLFFKVFLEGKISNYPIWIYLDEKYKLQPYFNNYDCVFWQYSHNGSIKGISGSVDLNKFLGSQNDFEKLLIK